MYICIHHSLYTYIHTHLCEIFPITKGLKQEDRLSPLLFNSALGCAVKNVQVNHDGFKLNGTYQRLVDAGDVNVTGRKSIC